MFIKPGKYIHFKGKEYEVIGTASHSETLEEVVVYRALYGEGGLWVRPAAMWDEIVDLGLRGRVKRFTRVDDIPPETPFGIHNQSAPAEKIELFMSLFVGRDDVFAKRWENVEKGSNGYVPVCGNEWSPSCPKYGGGKMRCGSCPNHNFVRYDKSAVEKHLKGLMTVGVYPMSPDETRRFLVFDFDGKGTLQQYAGRLHRLYDGKKEVQVYDYVDVHVAMLEKMYQKRLRGYAAIGYKTKGTPQPLEEARAIFDERTFFPVYCADVLAANSEILIVSPFVAKRRVLAALNYLTAAKAKVTVITKPPENYVPKDRGKITECVELLKQHDITVKTKERIHQKFAIMDQRVVWYGSINFLSYGASGESVMRIENLDVAGELSRGV